MISIVDRSDSWEHYYGDLKGVDVTFEKGSTTTTTTPMPPTPSPFEKELLERTNEISSSLKVSTEFVFPVIKCLTYVTLHPFRILNSILMTSRNLLKIIWSISVKLSQRKLEKRRNRLKKP